RPPDLIELAEFIRGENARLNAAATMDDATVFSLARALQGLTLDEGRFAIRRATSGGGGLGPGSAPALLEEKRLLVNRTGIVEYVADGTDLGHVGGLEDLKHWLLQRRKLFQLGDDVGADIVPKGVLVMGISGCGKSLSVKAIASYFALPLYRIEIGRAH